MASNLSDHPTIEHSELAINLGISHKSEIDLCAIASDCLNRHAGKSDLDEAFRDLMTYYNHVGPNEYTFLVFTFSVGVTKLAMDNIPNIMLN